MRGRVMVCEQAEIGETVRPLPEDLTEEDARTIVKQVADFFRGLVYEQPWKEALELSKRAENALRRHPDLQTVGEVATFMLDVRQPGQLKGAGYLCIREIKEQLKLATSVWG